MYGEAIFIAVIVALLFLAGFIIVYVFYLKNLQDMLKECDPSNLQIPPVNVWLMFIPLFNIGYGFIMYPKISESLKREFEYRNAPQPGDYLKGLGTVIPILNAAAVIPVQAIRGVIGLGNLVLLIIYWAKAAEMKNKLRSLPKGTSGVKFSDNPDLLD